MKLFDLRKGPHGLGAKGRRRWYRAERKARGVCFHHTGVHGGFGTHATVRKLYNPTVGEIVRSGLGSVDRYVKAQALGHRYRGMPERLNKRGAQPYHAVWNEHVGALYYLHPFDRITWHGNGANREFLGFAWDENSTKVGFGFDVSGAQDAVRRFVADARAEGHPIEEFTCHCAWTNKPSDPGAEFIDLVLDPLALELGVSINWDFKKPGARSMAEVVGRVSP